MEQQQISSKPLKYQWVEYIRSLQGRICEAIEQEDGRGKFSYEEWVRDKGKGGGGRTRVMADGKVIEKGGVNTSVVFGPVTDPMRRQLKIEGQEWFAAGISLILHPLNPFVPTVHANYRYFELYNEEGEIVDQWFGGGADLTPYYLFEEDAVHFHRTLKAACDPFGDDLYIRFKNWCDDYFVNTHRDHEARGIGGIFYDYLRPNGRMTIEDLLGFSKSNGDAFLKAYLPIVQKRKESPYNEENRKWQEIRRGRYVEFNLIHDRGTLFGLKTNGRTESILISLPPTVRFVYNHHPEEGSEEAKLVEVLRKPRRWI